MRIACDARRQQPHCTGAPCMSAVKPCSPCNPLSMPAARRMRSAHAACRAGGAAGCTSSCARHTGATLAHEVTACAADARSPRICAPRRAGGAAGGGRRARHGRRQRIPPQLAHVRPLLRSRARGHGQLLRHAHTPAPAAQLQALGIPGHATMLLPTATHRLCAKLLLQSPRPACLQPCPLTSPAGRGARAASATAALNLPILYPYKRS